MDASENVFIYGLGKSGLAAARLLLREGARVVAVDSKPDAAQGPDAQALAARGVIFRTGPVSPHTFDGASLLVVSPGVPLSLPEIAAVRGRGVPVWGEVELAYRKLDAGKPFVGITGTNGKSTTTALTGELFSRAGLRTFVGGNLGRPLSEAPLEEKPFDAHVVELSSFQLEGIEQLHCSSAAILNLTPDHIDRYKSQKEYGAAKARIFMNQRADDFAVVNADDSAVMDLARGAKSQLVTFSLEREANARPIERGFEVKLPIGQWRFSLGNRALRGAHNLQNAMAAALLALTSRISPEAIQRGLEAYPGLPHRLELARVLDGVEWINDSKATNVDSTLVALKAFPENVWLIAGGKGKGAPYAPMVEASRGRVKGLLTVGQDAPTLERAFVGVLPIHSCGTIENAIALARKLAQPGDAVLLSPACASYDQFKNFEHRGDAFKKWVQALT